MRSFNTLLATCLLLALGTGPLLAQSRPGPTLSQPVKLPTDRNMPLQVIARPPQLNRELAPAKRLELLNSARAVVQLPPVSTPPASTTRVSVGAARSSAGARIVMARTNFYGGPSQESPDGYLAMTAAGPRGSGHFVELSFPAQEGRHYVLDCTVRTEGGARPVQLFKVLGAEPTETAVGLDDHVMVVVRAEGPEIRRVLQSTAAQWWWSACDIAPVT
jgi:hypothetical protein